VAWVDAAGVLDGSAAVAARLGIAEPGVPLEVTAELVHHHLKGDGDWRLVVFDNVADPSTRSTQALVRRSTITGSAEATL
jgi:hypothetical protein